MELTVDQALQQGIAAHKEGKLQDAERLYQAILQAQPLHQDANHNLGVLAVSVNKIEAALPLFKTALESNPKTEQFWLSYIDALIKGKDFDNARQVLEQAKKHGVAIGKLNIFETLLTPTAQGNESKLASQKKSLKISEKHKKSAKNKKAKEKNHSSQGISPPQAQIDNLLKHYQSGRISDAEKLAVSITQEFPKHQLGWNVLGAILGQTRREAESVNAIQKATALSPQDAEAHYNLGVTLQKLGRLDEAEACYTQAIALRPDFTTAHYNLGDALKRLGRLDEAAASYTQAIALKPDFAEAHNNLGNMLKELGRLDEAAASYRQAIALKPDHAEAYSNLGVTLKGLGRLDEAAASYTQAIALKPDYAEAHSNLGNTLNDLGRLDEAAASYTQAIALKPDFAEAHSNLGAALLDLGRLDEAEASFTQAIALKPDFTEAHGNLGITLNAMGRIGSALQHFEKNLQLERGINPVNLRHKSFITVSKAKADHDIEQFEYLAALGNDVNKFCGLATLYKTVSSEINCTLDTDILPLSDKHQRLLGDTYNRPFHILEAPALSASAIGKGLDENKITEDYFEHDFGLTYFDNFLSSTALKSLRNFLLGSTIWFDFFHAGGYMGAYLKDGLASPLILQISEELRNKFPKIFKNHQLTHLWAYKYDSRACEKNNSFTGIKPHADAAAVNVNFWITPTSANLDPSSGGLVVYNAEAPLEWNFKTFNNYRNNADKIHQEILKCGQGKTIVPYNENRAVIFNSNLFHETDKIEFKEGYENRRINVTMLFGKRGA